MTIEQVKQRDRQRALEALPMAESQLADAQRHAQRYQELVEMRKIQVRNLKEATKCGD